MERYKYFKNGNEYEDYLSDACVKKIGSGREGIAYLTKDNDVVKRIIGDCFLDDCDNKDIYKKDRKIIMAQDYDVNTYLFPKQLLMIDDLIVGYVTDYFPNNIIKCRSPYNGDIKDIDADRLLAAYYEMVEDTKKISEDNVLVYDLTCNLLFNNEKLAAIDTLNYYVSDKSTLKENLETLSYALLCELHYHDCHFEPNYRKSVEYNLKRIKK